MNDFPHASSQAARMLTDGLRSAASERGLSLRQIGKNLNYSQAVVLSHMANGRVPIPLDRAPDIAREVGLPLKEFLHAVLVQRHPNIDWKLITNPGDEVTTELRELAGKPLESLSGVHQRVLREVVRDPDPGPRWLTISELPAVQFFRRLFPRFTTEGLSPDDRQKLQTMIEVWEHPAFNENDENDDDNLSR